MEAALHALGGGEGASMLRRPLRDQGRQQGEEEEREERVHPAPTGSSPNNIARRDPRNEVWVEAPNDDCRNDDGDDDNPYLVRSSSCRGNGGACFICLEGEDGEVVDTPVDTATNANADDHGDDARNVGGPSDPLRPCCSQCVAKVHHKCWSVGRSVCQPIGRHYLSQSASQSGSQLVSQSVSHQ
eukprot:GHVU01077505.1.p1 GENE.GHVU01077505.1~~GHVU01077505.1.p1  ORF type:complete len:185 (+),score=25.33 GHVU01077505.1:503-1057(+)